MSEKIRISEELYEQVKKIAESRGRSIREVVEEAIKMYLIPSVESEKPIKSVTSPRPITLRYRSKCTACRREMKEGELAYYWRVLFEDGTSRSFTVCLECYYKDTAVAEMYLRKRRLEQVIKGLEAKARELSERVMEMEDKLTYREYSEKLAECVDDLVKAYTAMREAILDYDRARIEEAVKRVEEAVAKVRELEAKISALILPPPKPVRKLKKAYLDKETF
ncbi:MAG: ribbon-helix-helix protein, CopG family [Thermosphaera sp.]